MTVAPRTLLALLFCADERRMRALAPSSAEAFRDLLGTCESLGASGLLHAALRRTRSTDLAPDDVRTRLRLVHATNTAHNLALCAEAKRVLAALAGAKLTAAPMKGVALFAENIIEDLGARPTGDFDVVTRRDERSAVLRTLRDLGYAPTFKEASWKHLPALWRGDLSIEVHEIAYWSPGTRAIFGADHLAHAGRATRIGRLCALQIHHLVLGSPPDAGLTVRTLADVDAFLRLARREPEVRLALLDAAGEAAIMQELAACDALLAEASCAPIALDLPSSPADAERLLAPLRATGPRDVRAETLAHALRLIPLQPWEVTRQMLSLIAFPPRDLMATRAQQRAGSPRVLLARVRRPFELVGRVVRALPAALRTRPGPRG